MLVFEKTFTHHCSMTRLPRIAPFVFTVLIGLIGTAKLQAQAGNIQYQVASLIEDVRILDKNMRDMSIMLEDMRRENDRLRKLVSDYESQSDSQLSKFVTLGQLNESLRKSVAALEKRDNLMKNEIIVEVKKSMETMLKAVGGSLSGTSNSKPRPADRTYFPTEGVPENGVPYTVAPGDSLAGIAKKLNSRVDWIQNANKIANPKLIQIGQVIYVPQAAE